MIEVFLAFGIFYLSLYLRSIKLCNCSRDKMLV